MTADDHTRRHPDGMESEPLRARVARHRWTAHNLELAPGVWTLPGASDFLATESRLAAILRVCRAFYGQRLDDVRVLDLACLEGGFSVGVALAGAEVLGLEAREDHLEKCLVARDSLALQRLTFARGDVKDVTRERFGSFDVVLALGILYHLDDPVGWLRQIAAMTRGVLFVDTHYAPPDEAGVEAVKPGLRSRLGPLERFERDGRAFSGRWFSEWTTEEERDARPWASWSNPSSLWLTKESLVHAMRHVGFDGVLEQYDYWMDRYAVFTGEHPRTMLIGLHSDELAARKRR